MSNSELAEDLRAEYLRGVEDGRKQVEREHKESARQKQETQRKQHEHTEAVRACFGNFGDGPD